MGFHDAVLAKYGGVAHTSEIYGAGYTQSTLRFSVGYGTIIRVRSGLYCRPDLPVDAIRALRVGGRLACASALAYHGAGEPPALLHVSVEGNTPRLRDPDTGAPARSPEGTVVHWSRRDLPGDRIAVSVEEAARQAERCRASRDSL